MDDYITCCSNRGMTSDAGLIYKSLYCAYSRNWHTSPTRGSGIKTARTKEPPLLIAPHKLQLEFVLSADRLITRCGWCQFNTLLRKFQFHYRPENSPSQHPILSQVNPVHTLTSFFLNPTLVPHCLLPKLALLSPFLPAGFLTWINRTILRNERLKHAALHRLLHYVKAVYHKGYLHRLSFKH
jgi:hypothetical protein